MRNCGGKTYCSTRCKCRKNKHLSFVVVVVVVVVVVLLMMMWFHNACVNDVTTYKQYVRLYLL